MTLRQQERVPICIYFITRPSNFLWLFKSLITPLPRYIPKWGSCNYPDSDKKHKTPYIRDHTYCTLSAPVTFSAPLALLQSFTFLISGGRRRGWFSVQEAWELLSHRPCQQSYLSNVINSKCKTEQLRPVCQRSYWTSQNTHQYNVICAPCP